LINEEIPCRKTTISASDTGLPDSTEIKADAALVYAARQQIEAEDAFNSHPSVNDDDPEVRGLEETMSERFKAVLNMKATTTAGLVAKARLLKRWHVGEDENVPHESLDHGELLAWQVANEIIEIFDRKPATAEQWAATDFEAWTHADDEWTPPTNEEWRQIAKTHLVTVRLAWALLYRTKAQLVEGLRELGDEDVNRMMSDFMSALHFFESTAKILKLAETRIICAGTVLEVEDGADD
jgi:hypothetical protein